MGKLIFTLIIVIVYIKSSYADVISSFQQRAMRDLTYALEHAVHDATLFIKDDALGEGYIDFDESLSYNAFKNSLTKNLRIDSDLKPTFDFFYEEPIEIVDMFYIDDNYIDPTTGAQVSFPYLFKYTYQGENFERKIFGPSIAAVIKTTVNDANESTVKLKVEEYKFKANR